MPFLTSLMAALSDALAPFLGTAATAGAVVLGTLCVRLALHPLARAAAKGERSRARLAPKAAELQKRYRRDPERLRRATADLYAKEGASPVAGFLPMLLQLPVFFALYHLFTTDDALLGHRLLGVPLGDRWADALDAGGVLGGGGLVFLGLFAVVTAVASWTYARARRASSAVEGQHAALLRLMPLMCFGTVITAAVVPLAAGLHLATTTAWTAVERAALGVGRAAAEPVGSRGSAGK